VGLDLDAECQLGEAHRDAIARMRDADAKRFA
jgi:hypothetical protein